MEDRDKVTGAYLFAPTYHEHHRSHLRDIFTSKAEGLQQPSFRDLKSLTFYGVQGHIVSQEDLAILEAKRDNIEKLSVAFMERDIDA